MRAVGNEERRTKCAGAVGNEERTFHHLSFPMVLVLCALSLALA